MCALIGIVEPLLVQPVRQIDLLFDPCSVEGALWESVDGEDVEVLIVKKLSEGVQFLRVCKGLSGLTGKPEPDSVGTVRRDFPFDLQHVLLHILENLRPCFSDHVSPEWILVQYVR